MSMWGVMGVDQIPRLVVEVAHVDACEHELLGDLNVVLRQGHVEARLALLCQTRQSKCVYVCVYVGVHVCA